ncbi:MAG: zinc dependent phospholipase C family protein [Deltaproteobacteria bacterium]|nr:zinc dependent phospholipase C family protein [Deltaproteobacteria bacterium]
MLKKTLIRLPVLLIGPLLVLLGLPEDALAWGPGVHMVTGNWLIQNLSMLSPEFAAAIAAHPGLFLQGCLSADIFIGKGCVAKEGHSHNWKSGLLLLDKAHTKAKLAYALGYLSHLAADTVAHNVFIPGNFQWAYSLEAARGSDDSKIINPAKAGGLGRGKMAHVFLEMKADKALTWDRKQALESFKAAGSKGAERMLMRSLNQKYWLFQLKKRLYRGSIALGGCGLRSAMRSLRNLGRLDAVVKGNNLANLHSYLDQADDPAHPAFPLQPFALPEGIAAAGQPPPVMFSPLTFLPDPQAAGPATAEKARKNLPPPTTPLGDLLVVSARAVADLLRDPCGTRVRNLDPVGTQALARASRGLGPREVMPVRLGSEAARGEDAPHIHARWPRAAAEVLLELPPINPGRLREDVKKE